MDIVAIVVTYNRKDMLMQCIQSLLGQKERVPDILIVDNASTDGTFHAISDVLDNSSIIYCNTGCNLGGAGGFQFGMKRAIELGYQFLWLMDDDCLPEEGALSALCKAHERYKGQYGFLCSRVNWVDGTLCSMNRQHVSYRRRVDPDETNNKQVIMSTFVSFFVKTETARRYGFPIKEFVIWGDDFEYSRRISKKENCYFVPESRVLHQTLSNEKVGIERDDVSRIWRYDYLYRNEYYLYARDGLVGRVFFFAMVLLHSARVIFSGSTDKFKRLRTIWRSYAKGFSFHPEIEWPPAIDRKDTN